MNAPTETRLFTPEGADLFRTVAISMAVAVVVVTAAMTLLVKAVAPDWSTAGAFGIGAMVGFWSSPLVGGVVGNGIHHHRMHKAGLPAADEEPIPGSTGGGGHAAVA